MCDGYERKEFTTERRRTVSVGPGATAVGSCKVLTARETSSHSAYLGDIILTTHKTKGHSLHQKKSVHLNML